MIRVAIAVIVLLLLASCSSQAPEVRGTFGHCSAWDTTGATRISYLRRGAPVSDTKYFDLRGERCVGTWVRGEGGGKTYTIQVYDVNSRPISLLVVGPDGRIQKLRYGTFDIRPEDIDYGHTGVVDMGDDHFEASTAVEVIYLPGDDVPYDLDPYLYVWWEARNGE